MEMANVAGIMHQNEVGSDCNVPRLHGPHSSHGVARVIQSQVVSQVTEVVNVHNNVDMAMY
jgi:hypothetical protein